MDPDIDHVREKRRNLFEGTQGAATGDTQSTNDHVFTGDDDATNQQIDAQDPPLKRLRLSVTPTDSAIMPLADEKTTHAQALQLFVSKLHMKCAKCSQDITEDFQASVEKKPGFSTDCTFVGELSVTGCTKCGHLTCLGCGLLYHHSHEGQPWHCPSGRVVYVWHVLCLHDAHASHNRAVPAAVVWQDSSVSSVVCGQRAKKAGLGTGYSGESEDDGWYGQGLYHSGLLDERPKVDDEAGRAKLRQTALDQSLLIATSAGLCRALLCQKKVAPGSAANHVLDSMLLCSSVLGRLATLVQNATIEDIERCSYFYTSVGSALATLSDYTNECLSVPQQAGGDTRNILDLSFGKSSWTVNSGGLCLANLIENLAVRCRLVLSADGEKSVGAEARQVCNGFVRLANDLVSVSEPEPCGAVQSLLDDDILKVHRYAPDAMQIVNVVPRRMRRLLDELSILKTSLPPGIFVRHCESRLDVLKVLIVGPQGTPYADGLFEFDLFCPSHFPYHPPKMFFRTTNNGTVSFNPNLYAEGKVCLSLLGTYEGEPWNPEQSSLLQLLISVQAMIFCEHPWTNEPGQGSLAGTVYSRRYNFHVRTYTVQYAMVDWLLKLGGREPGIWAKIIADHFAACGCEIVQTVCDWLTEIRAFLPVKFEGTGTVGRVLGRVEPEVQKEEAVEQTVLARLQTLAKEMQGEVVKLVGTSGPEFGDGMFEEILTAGL